MGGSRSPPSSSSGGRDPPRIPSLLGREYTKPMDREYSKPKVSVKDRLGPVPPAKNGSGKTGRGRNKSPADRRDGLNNPSDERRRDGFSQDHWRGGSDTAGAKRNKAPGREERGKPKSSNRREDSPAAVKRKRGEKSEQADDSKFVSSSRR